MSEVFSSSEGKSAGASAFEGADFSEEACQWPDAMASRHLNCGPFFARQHQVRRSSMIDINESAMLKIM